MARPPVSVSSVRVSLTVMTKQRTAAGAVARCAVEDMPPIILRCAYDLRRSPQPVADASISRRLALPLCRGVPRAPAAQSPLDRDAERWVTQTLAKLTLDDRIGQLIAPAFDSTYLPTDSDEFDRLSRSMRDSHVGGGDCVRRHRAGAAGAAEPELRHGRARPAAVRWRVDAQPPAGGGAGAAAGHRRLRVRRRHAHRRRHALPARDGAWRGRRRAAGVRGGPHHRASRAARSACTSTSRRSPTSTTTRATR